MKGVEKPFPNPRSAENVPLGEWVSSEAHEEATRSVGTAFSEDRDGQRRWVSGLSRSLGSVIFHCYCSGRLYFKKWFGLNWIICLPGSFPALLYFPRDL